MPYIFPVRFEGDDVLKHIFPTKQKTVQEVIELAKADERIKKVIVFGSAITIRCGMNSDLDISIEAENYTDFADIASPFFRIQSSEVDIIDYNDVRNQQLKNDIKKGVCIYVKS